MMWKRSSETICVNYMNLYPTKAWLLLTFKYTDLRSYIYIGKVYIISAQLNI